MAQPTTPMPRRKGPPAALQLDSPVTNIQIALGNNSASTSAASSPSSELLSIPFCPPPKKSLRNMKRLSLTLPTDYSPTKFPIMQPTSDPQSSTDDPPETRPRRPSVVSLPAASINTMLHRKEEDGSPTVPYIDGPIQIIPGVWLGSEDNARDWKGLLERGIKTILNVAKEVISPFDSAASQPLRPFVSTPDLYKKALEHRRESDSTFYPAHLASGRPGMHYLKLDWSHGEADLVAKGFPLAMAFVDAALRREEGVLIHCQCGISRSATLVIALVMRAAALCSTSVPPEVWALKGYQQAYSFVKNKSKWVGPNMSLIYQLLEYERALKSGDASPTPSERSSTTADEEEEWGRRRRMMDEETLSDAEEHESSEVAREARALDKAMEDRIIARKSSISSIASSGMGMGPAWRSRYDRKRAGSIGSTFTSTASMLSEDLVEEDEEEALLGVGGGFDSASSRHRASSGDLETCSTSSESPIEGLPSTLRPTPCTPLTARPLALARPPPSAPAFRKSFNLPPTPQTSTRSTFNIHPPALNTKVKRRPAPLGLLSPVPSSPLPPAAPEQQVPPMIRTESKRHSSHSVHLQNALQIPFPTSKRQTHSALSTPSQTLFVFPPDMTPAARTPSTMTLMNPGSQPVLSTPRVSTFRSQGRTKSFIGLGIPATPTIATSRVDAKGCFGLEHGVARSTSFNSRHG